MNFILDFSDDETNSPEEAASLTSGQSEWSGDRKSLPPKKTHKKSFERSQSLASISLEDDPDILQNLSLLHLYNSTSANRKFIKDLYCPPKEIADGNRLAPRKSFSGFLEVDQFANEEGLVIGAAGYQELGWGGFQQEVSTLAFNPNEKLTKPELSISPKQAEVLGENRASPVKRDPSDQKSQRKQRI